MNIDQWHCIYKPISNQSGESFGVCLGDDVQIVHQIHGVDMEAVLNADPACVWTMVDGEGKAYIVDGQCFVNREGYLITSVPYSGEFVEIPIGDEEEEVEEE